MSFPRLDRCSCGSPTSSKEGDKKYVDGGLPTPQNKNDYKISPTKKRVATSNNFSNENATISSARSQPSLRDENFKNLFSSGRSARINNQKLQKSKLDDVKKSPNNKNQNSNGSTDTSKAENQTNASKPHDKTEPALKNKLIIRSTAASRNVCKPSSLNVVEVSNDESEQTSTGKTGVSSRPTSKSCHPPQTETETASNTEYTPLSYDVNYVKVSPPRLTRRPKKCDDNTDNNNNNSGLLSRAQQIGGGRLTSEDKQKKTLRALPRTPPDENKTYKNVSDDSSIHEEVLELTFTVLLEKGTLKKVNKSKGEDTNSAMVKLKTDNVKLDEDSKRLVAESITEVLRENTNFGNVALVQVADDVDGPINNKTSHASRATNSNSTGLVTNKEKINGVIKSPINDRNSLISKSFDSKESKLQEATTSYQSLDRKHIIQKDRRQLDGIREAGTSTIEHEAQMGKKYQALKNFSPLHNRLTTSAIIHRGQGQINESKKNRITNYHSRYDSDICDYETKERNTQKMISKSFNNKVCIKNKHLPLHHFNSGRDSNVPAAEDELTHMNWDDLMQEAKSLGIPLRRPQKMHSNIDKEVLKNSQSNMTSRFFKNFVSKKTGLKLTKSICGGELGRTRDEYFNDLASTSYQSPYETKKNSPFKEKFSFVDLILGRSKSSKTLNDDCPLCRQQQPMNIFNRGKNLIRRSISTNRGINSKQKQLRCPKDHCYDYGCTCYCTCKNNPGIESKTSRSNSSPPPMLSKHNFCRKASCNAKCYDVFCNDFKNSKMTKTAERMMFDTYTLSNNYRSLLSPKKSANISFPPESFCCQPYTPQIHRRHFKLLHLNSCGDDAGYDDDNDVDDNKDDVFIDESEGLDFKNSKVQQPITKRELSKSVGFDYPDKSNKNKVFIRDKTSISKVNQNNSTGFLRSLQLLKDKSWYWGNMTFEKAEAILSDMEDGSFLVRDSSDDRYILSVSFRSQGRTHHTRIEHIHGVFSFYSQRANTLTSSSNPTPSIDTMSSTSIIDFIDDAVLRSWRGENLYYLREVNDPAACPTPVRLLHPVSKPEKIKDDGCQSSVLEDVKA